MESKLTWIDILDVYYLLRDMDRKLNTILRKEALMATQADVDAVAAQLDGLKTEVAKIGSDLAAFLASNQGASIDVLKQKASDVAAALQAVDDLVPEQPAP